MILLEEVCEMQVDSREVFEKKQVKAALTPYVAPPSGVKYTVTASTLNIRSLPSVKGTVIASAKSGSVVTDAMHRIPNPGWYTAQGYDLTSWKYVESAGKLGWASLQYLSSSGPGIRYKIIVDSTELRRDPSDSAPSLGKITLGTMVLDATKRMPNLSLFSNQGYDVKNWIYVEWVGKLGWIPISAIKSAPPPAIEKAISTATASAQRTSTVYNNTAPSAADAKALGAFKSNVVYNEIVVPNMLSGENSAEVNPTKGILPDTFNEPGFFAPSNKDFKRFKMIIYTKDKTKGTTVARIFTMNIGPQAYTQNFANLVVPTKTGGGFLINRSGQDIPRMQLSGILLDTKESDERREFLDSYYNAYLVDKVNAFNEYFNDNILLIQLAGYKYYGILVNFVINKNAQSLYLYNYNMEFLVTSMSRMKA
jgi:hypothetical protein